MQVVAILRQSRIILIFVLRQSFHSPSSFKLYLKQRLEELSNMSIIVDIAHAGDLVVAIGQGSTQKTARISSVIIKSASLVFRTMLGPSVSVLFSKIFLY